MADPMITARLEVVKRFRDDFQTCLNNITCKNSQYVLYFFITIKLHSTDYFNSGVLDGFKSVKITLVQEIEERRDAEILIIDDMVAETDAKRRGLTVFKTELMVAVSIYLFQVKMHGFVSSLLRHESSIIVTF